MKKKSPWQLQREWEEFDEKNPHVYRLVCQYTDEVIQAGYLKFGMAAVWERVRWEIMVGTRSEHFKMPNNHRAYCARQWLDDHPEYPKFFRTAVLRSRRHVKVDRFGRPLSN